MAGFIIPSNVTVVFIFHTPANATAATTATGTTTTTTSPTAATPNALLLKHLLYCGRMIKAHES